MAKKRKPAPAPETDQVQQMWDYLLEVAANAREVNASPLQDEIRAPVGWGHTILNRLTNPRRAKLH